MSNQIKIRAIESTDVDDLYEMQQQPRLVWGTLQNPLMSKDAIIARAANTPADMVILVAEIDGKVVASASLRYMTRPRTKHVGSLGMGVHDAYQGRGVGTALMNALVDLADNWYQLYRLELEVYPDNGPAVALYKKFGFEEEGIKRFNAFREGVYVDSMVMGRLKPGWKPIRHRVVNAKS